MRSRIQDAVISSLRKPNEAIRCRFALTSSINFQSLTNGVIYDTINAMGTHEKLLARMRNNPRDWRIDDLKSVANRFGIDWRNEGGSHHVFSFPGVDDDVCVPSHRPIKPVYVRQFVTLIDKAKELQS